MVSRAGPDDDLDMGRIQAFDKNLLIYALNGTAPRAPYVSANVNLWPETTVVLANPHLLSSLSQTQRGWLRRAAVEAAASSTELADLDTDLVAPLCRRGARFANATEMQLTALRQALAPVYAGLGRDQQTSRFIADIELLKSSVHARPLKVPTACTGTAPRTSAPPSGPGQNRTSVLNGVYRMNLFHDDLVALGIRPANARASAATHTITFKNGRWTYHSALADARRLGAQPIIGREHSLDCGGAYSVADHLVTLVADRLPNCNRPGGHQLSAVWTRRGGDLTLAAFRGVEANDFDRLVWGGSPWRRVGDPPSGTELRQ